MTLMEHLEDLRRVLVICAVTLAITTGIVYGFFRRELYDWVTSPLQQYHVPLVFIGLGEAFMTQIKLAFFAGFILALPVILWQVWGFIVPALQPEERRKVRLIVPLSVVLFLAGAAFAYFAVFRFAARFLILVAGPDLQPMISIGQYVSFLISFLLPFGLAFELPLIIYFLAHWGVVSGDWLAKNRKFAILIIFVAAAALTPGPDVISQLLMAGPLLLLYEVSIWAARAAGKGREAAQAGPGKAEVRS
ncbi:MAG: twin-arginine translocase subunit TatC [Clostridia bacterium]|nr:MAG: twin-arginine translocase subunit TatC [Clostridia bacterium]